MPDSTPLKSNAHGIKSESRVLTLSEQVKPDALLMILAICVFICLWLVLWLGIKNKLVFTETELTEAGFAAKTLSKANIPGKTNIPSKTNTPSKSKGAESAIYVKFPKPFIVSIKGGTRNHLAKIVVQLQLSAAKDEAEIRQYLPVLSSELEQLFTRARLAKFTTAAGKETIRTQALWKVQTVLEQLSAASKVDKLLFTEFVIQ